MIEWLAAAALLQAQAASQSDFQREGPALVEQASGRVFDAHEALAFELGKCARILPTGSSLPSVSEASVEVAEIGIPELSDALARIYAVSFAEGLQADQRGLSPRGCADEIDALASDQVQHTRGLRGLLETLLRDAQQTGR
ncbi:hypothetical protein [Brevundimonas sp. LjRoot202]|uniref:hypothetical protein n=1 Tax=Brevundimonas sp. LjRoot202 TaxID=3342281 RepID=UPI003ECD1177